MATTKKKTSKRPELSNPLGLTWKIAGELEIDSNRGVIYFHAGGQSILRVCNLPRPIPVVRDRMLDVTHMVGADWGGGKPTPFRATGKRTKLVSLACDKDRLHALDDEGRVWRYVPATKDRYAFWSPLTEKRAGEDKP